MKNIVKLGKAISMITQIGISMMVPVFLCIFVGGQLDKLFQTSVCFILFLILGFLAGFRNIYYLTRSFYAKDKVKEDKELQYFEDLKKEREKK